MIWHAKNWKVNVCGWFIHRTICWILLFIIWQTELRGQHCVGYYTNQIVLNTLWNSYLNQATKNFPIPKEIPWWKFSKQKRNRFIISVTSTHPSPSNPLAGPRVKRHCLRCSNQCRWLVINNRAHRTSAWERTTDQLSATLQSILQHAIWLACGIRLKR